MCLTEFHNRTLVTAEVKKQPSDSYKTKLHFSKMLMHVLYQQRLGVNVFHITELKKIYTEFLVEDCIEYTPHITWFAQRLKVELELLFYCNNGVEICTIDKSVLLYFYEDVDEIVCNELQNRGTFVTSLMNLLDNPCPR